MLIAIGLYVALQMALGLWVSRRVRTEDDYLLAGRRLGPVMATTSMFATWFGAESCVGAAGSIYQEGLGWHSVEPFAYGLCLVLLGLLFARRLWHAGITTVADLLHQRCSPAASTIAALLMVPTSLLWAGAQIRAFGHVLAVNSDGLLGDEAAIAIAAVVVVVYTGAGGLLADVVTDLVQGFALVIGIAALCVVVVVNLGGVGAAIDQVAALPARAPAEPLSPLALVEMWAIPLLGSVTAQEAVSRSLAARSPATARQAAVWGGVIYLVVGLMPVGLGLLGPALLPGLDDGEQLLPRLSSEHMPAVVHLLFSGALVSAMLSTVDSSLLAASAVLTRNVFVFHARLSPKNQLRLARTLSVGCGVAAWALAHAGDSVGDLVEQASGFGSAGIFVLVLLSLYGRRPLGTVGPILCLGAGALSWVTSLLFPFPYPYLTSLLASIAGLVLGRAIERMRRPANAG